MGSSFINVGDKSVILVDCTNKTPEDFEEIYATLQEARDMMASAADKSVYLITDLTKSKINPELVTAFNDFSSAITKYIRQSVLVGLSDHHKIIVSIFRKLHKRDFFIVDTLDDAKTYMSFAK